MMIFFEYVIHYLTLYWFLNQNINKINKFGFVFFSIISFAGFNSILSILLFSHITILIKTIINLTLFISFAFLLFKSSTFKKIIFVMTMHVFLTISELISINIVNIFVDINTIFKEQFYYIVAFLIANLICLTFLKLYTKIFNLNSFYDFPRYSFVLLAWPLISSIILSSLEGDYQIFKNNLLSFFLILLMLNITFFVNTIFFKMTILIQVEKELEISKMKETYYSENLSLLNEHFSNSFIFLHNTINKFSQLKSEIPRDSINLNILASEIGDSMLKEFNEIYSSYSILNTLIISKKKLLSKNSISIETVMQYTDFYFLGISCAIELFESLLFLAINSCLNSTKERYILIKTKKDKNFIIIRTIFTSSEFYNSIDFADKILDIKALIAQLNLSNSYTKTRFNINTIEINIALIL